MQPVLTQVPPKSFRSTTATVMPAPVRRPARAAGLAGADDDRVERFHDSERTISTARPMATASSVNAAGGSLPNIDAQSGAERRAAQRADDRADDAGDQPRREASSRRTDGCAGQPAGQQPRAKLHRHFPARRRRQLIGDELDERQHSKDSCGACTGEERERRAGQREATGSAPMLTAAGAVIARRPATMPINRGNR